MYRWGKQVVAFLHIHGSPAHIWDFMDYREPYSTPPHPPQWKSAYYMLFNNNTELVFIYSHLPLQEPSVLQKHDVPDACESEAVPCLYIFLSGSLPKNPTVALLLLAPLSILLVLSMLFCCHFFYDVLHNPIHILLACHLRTSIFKTYLYYTVMNTVQNIVS